ncbi:MAG: ArsR family transcriptional regulator [Alteromonadaceae bacterium]|nr:MAG: ArsR family transcriptional regulator [Alteromonadaceae bacterium]
MQRYILHWGEMGTRWGVNRSVSQIHALLYLSPEALSAEDIASLLSVARSNVSNSLKELQSRRLVVTEQVLGDRRDYFKAQGDTWEMLITIIEERKKRELDPTQEMLVQCVAEMANDKDTPESVKSKIRGMAEFVGSLLEWFEQMKSLPRGSLIKLIKMGKTISRFMPGKRG